jgi:RNA polymerase sigma-70 factor (ECF subfamily)
LPADEGPILELLARRAYREAVELLVEYYFDQVYDFCVRGLRDRNAARDVTQRVFLEAFRDIAKFRGDSTLRTWLFGIADHRWKDERKSRERRDRRLDPDHAIDVVNAADPAPDPAEETERRRRRSALEDCMQRLNELIREAIDMHYILGLSYEEMSKMLGAKPGTLQRRVARAWHTLRRCLEMKGISL